MPLKKKVHEKLDQYDYVGEEWIGEASPDYSTAIGLFLIQFSSLEHEINTSLAEEMNQRSHDMGYQVVELLKMSNKIQLLSRLVKLMLTHINPPKRKEFKIMIEELKQLNTFRNKIVHANWMSLSKDGSVRTRIVIDPEEGSVQFERTKMSLSIIYRNINRIASLEEKLFDFLETSRQY